MSSSPSTTGRTVAPRIVALSLLVALLGLFAQGVVAPRVGAGETYDSGRSMSAQNTDPKPDNSGESDTEEVAPAPSVESVDARGKKWLMTGVSPGGAPEVSSGEEVLETTATDITTDVVIVIDNDRALSNGNLQLSGDAAATLLPGFGPIRSVGVVSTAKKGARVVQPLTTDETAVTERDRPDRCRR